MFYFHQNVTSRNLFACALPFHIIRLGILSFCVNLINFSNLRFLFLLQLYPNLDDSEPKDSKSGKSKIEENKADENNSNIGDHVGNEGSYPNLASENQVNIFRKH